MSDLRFLTIRQPWAVAISHGDKRVENRTWHTPYRGLIAIHAARTDDRDGWASPVIAATLDGRTRHDGLLPRGAIVAVAQLVGCHRAASPTCCQPWGVEEAWHFELTDVRALSEPVPMLGMLGIRPVPDEIAALVLERVA